jgi:hypothetical protein
MPVMSREDLVRFARRDWAAVAVAKERHWLRQKRAMSPADVLQLSDDMRRHARALLPDGPLQADREPDLATHDRVGQALRAVAHTSR